MKITVINKNFPIHEELERSTIESNSAIDGENLCISCGMCCDGTLFSQGKITKKEFNTINQKENIKDEKYIQMPCPYFKEHSCSIYNDRFLFCIDYKCSLLKSVISGKLIYKDAKKILNTTLMQIGWIKNNFPFIIKDSKSDLRDDLYTIQKVFIKRLEENKDLTPKEIQFCLNVLDYQKGLALHFHRSSLLDKYDNLILKIRKKN